MTDNSYKLADMAKVTISCDFCNRNHSTCGWDVDALAESLDEEGWTVSKDDKVKCPKCKYKRKSKNK